MFSDIVRALLEPLISYVHRSESSQKILAFALFFPTFFGGIMLAYTQPEPLSYIGWFLAIPALLIATVAVIATR